MARGKNAAVLEGRDGPFSPASSRGNPLWVVVGLVGSLFASLCCIGIAPLVTLVTTVGLGFMLSLTVLPPLFAFFVAVGASGLWYSYRRHRNPFPLILQLAGGLVVLVLLYGPLHGPLVWIGLGAVIVAAAWNIRLEYVYWHREPGMPFSGTQ